MIKFLLLPPPFLSSQSNKIFQLLVVNLKENPFWYYLGQKVRVMNLYILWHYKYM